MMDEINKQIIANYNKEIHFLEFLNGSKKTICHLVELKGKRKIRTEIQNEHIFFDLIFKLGLKLKLPPKKAKLKGKTYVQYIYK